MTYLALTPLVVGALAVVYVRVRDRRPGLARVCGGLMGATIIAGGAVLAFSGGIGVAVAGALIAVLGVMVARLHLARPKPRKAPPAPLQPDM